MLRFNASEVKEGAIPTGVMGVFFLNQHKEIIYIVRLIKKRLHSICIKAETLASFFAFLFKVFSPNWNFVYESQQIKKH